MASVPVENTVEVELVQGLDGELIENTLYFHNEAAWTEEGCIDLGAALVTWWDTYMQSAFTTSTALVNIKITDLTGPLGPAIEYSTGLPLAGSGGEEAMSSNVAPAITFRTASRGRSHRGRNYISGLPVSQVTQNRMLGAYADFLVAGYTQLLSLASTLDITWVVVSRYSGVTIVDGRRKPTPRAVGITTPITSVGFKDLVVDSQRRRLPNH